MTLRLKVLELVQQGKTVPEIRREVTAKNPALTPGQISGVIHRLRLDGTQVDGGPRSEIGKQNAAKRTPETFRKIAEKLRGEGPQDGAKAVEVARREAAKVQAQERAQKLFAATVTASTGDQTVALPETRHCDGGHVVPLDYAASKRASIAGPTLAPRPGLPAIKPAAAPILSNLRCLWTAGEDWRTWKLCEARCADGKPFCPEHAKRGLIRRQQHPDSIDQRGPRG